MCSGHPLRFAKSALYVAKRSGCTVEKGFTSDYVGHDNIVASTIKTLEAWSSAWFRETYFAPYTCLVGPTMIGKSRLPKELAKEVCVIYICLRPVGSTGEPPRSQFATEMLARQYSEEHYDRLITAVLSVAIDFYEEVPKTSDRSKSRDLVGSNDTPSDLRRAAQSICENAFFKSTQLKVVLAIDEASALLEMPPNEDVTRFQKFCCSLKNVPNRAGIFAVLVDTDFRIANSLPNSRYDRSSRNIGARAGQGLRYPPIYQSNV
ncbi:hypothetical protein MJO28_000568 [Puccinia striiformis f. sp. tritici]|uniref:Uncharacterized protein n=2 Tax=Puccinia striiformis f. sp. tritici TaxID=168172 RepID=A0ACC0EXK5_9BASI|nr:hypothetical protein MJO28_004796 [Puccinia striiformis f. sp. tritici]KAI7962474.1 hypothetical protein MJO28_000568 [Puccinia striiformis f. sp. tritici]